MASILGYMSSRSTYTWLLTMPCCIILKVLSCTTWQRTWRKNSKRTTKFCWNSWRPKKMSSDETAKHVYCVDAKSFCSSPLSFTATGSTVHPSAFGVTATTTWLGIISTIGVIHVSKTSRTIAQLIWAMFRWRRKDLSRRRMTRFTKKVGFSVIDASAGYTRFVLCSTLDRIRIKGQNMHVPAVQ